MKQHFFLAGGQFLGSADRKRELVERSSIRAPQSYAFFCPTCAEVWARCPVEREDGTHEPFRAISRGCKQHTQHGMEVGGSLWLTWDETFSNCLPEEVVRRELELHLALYPET